MLARSFSRRRFAAIAAPILPTTSRMIIPNTVMPNTDVAQGWDELLTPFLLSDFWNERDIYDAAHVLMVPLYVAADPESPGAWLDQIDDAISRFLDSGPESLITLTSHRVALTQFVYFLSEFAILREGEPIADQLSASIHDFVHELWAETEAWQWAQDPFPNMRDRLTWKLSDPDVEQSYYRAIIDEENFLLATAANLAHLGYRDSSASVDESLTYAEKILREKWQFTDDGGAIFQPGVWTDERDYRYAGHSEPAADMEPTLIPGISSDSSHGHRWPKWLHSYIRSAGSAEFRDELTRIQAAFANQFFDVVLVRPDEEFPSFRTTNYLDGRNGLYRWNYGELESGTGYLPWELSGTLTLGWWSFLPDDRAEQFYLEFAACFPLPGHVINTYAGPDTARERFPQLIWPDFFANGSARTLVELAALNAVHT